MMKKTISSILLAAALSGLSACHTAKHTLSRGNKPSSVLLVDAPEGAILRTAGKSAVADSDGEARLVLTDGWHDVSVFVGSAQVHSERMFLQDGTQKTIDLEP